MSDFQKAIKALDEWQKAKFQGKPLSSLVLPSRFASKIRESGPVNVIKAN